MNPHLRTLAVVVLLSGCSLLSRTPVANPDPNHTHADFAVWMDSKQMEFSGPEFMSGSSDVEEEGEHPHEHLHEYLHLHDGNGHVIHRHKPGLTLTAFFDSLKIGFSGACFTSGMPMQDGEVCGATPLRLFVNGVEKTPFSLDYAFQDLDHILITNAASDADVQSQIRVLTDDACRYSKTCPWKGEPPTEGCVADPEVPCRE